jgi:hypothetical protein
MQRYETTVQVSDTTMSIEKQLPVPKNKLMKTMPSKFEMASQELYSWGSMMLKVAPWLITPVASIMPP